jgi:hypothetical protein
MSPASHLYLSEYSRCRWLLHLFSMATITTGKCSRSIRVQCSCATARSCRSDGVNTGRVASTARVPLVIFDWTAARGRGVRSP